MHPHIPTSVSRRPIAVALSTGLLVATMFGSVHAQSPAASAAAPAASAGAAATGLDGTWTVDHTIGSYDYPNNDFSGSWAGYRAQEELAGVGGTTAVGRTPDIDGTLTLDGSTVSGVDMTVDLTTLASDETMRDGQLGQQGVQTDQFPNATFVLTEPIDLGEIPAENTPVTVTAVGDLTLHGMTKSVSIPLTAVWSGDIIGVSGSLTFTWGDFGMTQPTSMRVVSLANDVTMEFQAFFRHDAASSSAAPAASPAG